VKADYRDISTDHLGKIISTISSDCTYCRSLLGQGISPDGISKLTVYCCCYESCIGNIHELKCCVFRADFGENLWMCTCSITLCTRNLGFMFLKLHVLMLRKLLRYSTHPIYQNSLRRRHKITAQHTTNIFFLFCMCSLNIVLSLNEKTVA
jgi:hypothetical protein